MASEKETAAYGAATHLDGDGVTVSHRAAVTWNWHLEPEAVPHSGSRRRGRRPGAVLFSGIPASDRLALALGRERTSLLSEAASTGGGGLATHRGKGRAAADANETLTRGRFERGMPVRSDVRLQ